MSTQNKYLERNRVIDVMRAIGIIGVIAAHANFQRFSPNALSIIDSMQYVFGACVLLFFFTAGVLSVNNNQQQLQSYLLKRARKLLVPCIAFSVLYRTTIFLIDRFIYELPHQNFPVSLQEWFGFILFPVGPQFYFLWYLFLVTLLSHVLVNWKLLPLRSNVLSMLVIASISCAYFMGHTGKTYGPDLALLPLYFVESLLGLHVAMRMLSLKHFWGLLSVSVVVAFAVNNSLFIQPFVPTLLFLSLKETQFSHRLRLIAELGQRSGDIFVWHAPIVMPAISLAVVKFTDMAIAQVLCLFVFTTAVSLALGYIVRITPFRSVFKV